MSDMDARMDEQAVAERVAEVMYADDVAARHLGITIDEVGPGYAKLSMTVSPDMINGHDICHGGMTFSLADTAFAYACNSRNEATVAGGCSIEFLAPAMKGARLTAVARETARRGRQGIYDMTVTDDNGTVIAVMRGKSASLRRPVFED